LKVSIFLRLDGLKKPSEWGSSASFGLYKLVAAHFDYTKGSASLDFANTHNSSMHVRRRSLGTLL